MKLSKLISVLFITILLVACGGGGSDATPIPTLRNQTSSSPLTIELNGDSLMFGLEINKNIGKYLKETNPQWVIDDRGVAGLTMKDLNSGYTTPFPNASSVFYPRGAQLNFKTVQRTSNIVVIALGGNDAYSGFSTNDYELNLKAIVDVLISEKRTPILVGIPPMKSSLFSNKVNEVIQANNAIMHTLAIEKSIIFVEWDKTEFIENETIDGIHRNQIGSDKLAFLIAQAIKKYFTTNTY